MLRFSFYNSNLLNPDISSFLSSGYNSGVSSFVLKDVEGFSSDGFIIFQELGHANWEILPIDSINIATNTITTSSASSFAHSVQTKVYYSRYNSVRLYHGTTANTPTTLIAAKLVNGGNVTEKGEKITVLEDSVNNTGFAFLVMYDSVTPTESTEFSDPIPYVTATNTVQYVIDMAYRQLRKQEDSVLTTELCFDYINECTQRIRDTRRKFSDLNDLEDSLGSLVTGKWNYSLPTDIHSAVTNSSIYALRLLGEPDLEWIDKLEWNMKTTGFVYSRITSQITSGATEISVTDSASFDSEGGTVYIGSDIVTYTGASNNTLTGVTGVTQTHAVDTWVFESGVNRGKPQYYTVIDSELFLYPVPDSTHSGYRLMIDYDKDVSFIDSMNDQLPFPSMLYIPYLKAGMLETQNYGEPSTGSNQLRIEFERRLNQFFNVDPRVKKNRMYTSLYANPVSPIRTSRTRVKNW